MSDWEQEKWVEPFKNESDVRERFLQTGYNSGFLYHHWRIEPGLGATEGLPDLALFVIVENKIELCHAELKCLDLFKLRNSQREELPHLLDTDNLLFYVNAKPNSAPPPFLQLAHVSNDNKPMIEKGLYSFGHYFCGQSAWNEIARCVRIERGKRAERAVRKYGKAFGMYETEVSYIGERERQEITSKDILGMTEWEQE